MSYPYNASYVMREADAPQADQHCTSCDEVLDRESIMAGASICVDCDNPVVAAWFSENDHPSLGKSISADLAHGHTLTFWDDGEASINGGNRGVIISRADVDRLIAWRLENLK